MPDIFTRQKRFRGDVIALSQAEHKAKSAETNLNAPSESRPPSDPTYPALVDPAGGHPPGGCVFPNRHAVLQETIMNLPPSPAGSCLRRMKRASSR